MNNKIALVTGANKGIGFEICRQLAQAGFKVILTARDENRGKQSLKELVSENRDVLFFQLDVRDEKSIHAAADFVQKEFGKLDVLVNNAGIVVNSNDFTTAKIEDLRKTFDTNFFGAMSLSTTLLPLLRKSRDARIINISSGMGAFSEMGGGYLAYRTSKTALNSLTAVMALDLAGTNIKVNAVCPGWVRTDMGGKSASRNVQEGADTAVWLATEKNIPSGKFFMDRKQINW